MPFTTTNQGGLTGVGATITVTLLQDPSSDYGLLYLRHPVSGVPSTTTAYSNTNAPSGATLEKVLVFTGVPMSVADFLSNIQYVPPLDWHGNATAIIRVQLASTLSPTAPVGTWEATTVATTIGIVVLEYNHPPYFIWQDVQLPNTENVTFTVQSGNRMRLNNVLSFRTGNSMLPSFVNGSRPEFVMDYKGLQVADADIGAAAITVSLSVLRGSISLEREAPNIGVGVAQMFLANTKVPINQTFSLSAGMLATGNSSTGPLMLIGTVAHVNAVLTSLTYQNTANTGYDYIQIAAWDNGNGGDGTLINASCSNTLRVEIVPVNHPPVIALVNTPTTKFHNKTVGLLHLLEDVVYPIGDHFSVTDPDLADGTDLGMTTMVFASIQVSYGTISFGVLSGIQLFTNQSNAIGFNEHFKGIDVDLDNGRGMYMKGFFADVKQTILSAMYTPDANWYGVDMAILNFNDLGGVGSGMDFSVSQSILLDVANVPSPPVLLLPEQDTLVCLEDMVGVIGMSCCDWTTHSFGHTVMNMSISSFQVRSLDVLLKTRTKRFIASYTTVHGLSTQIRSNRSNVLKTVPQTLSVSVPYDSAKANKTYASADKEDVYLWVNATDLPSEKLLFTVSLSVNHGTLTMMRVTAAIEFQRGSGFQDDVVVFTGPLIDVNVALAGLNYRPDLNWNSLHQTTAAALRGLDTVDKLTIVATDANGLSVRSTVAIVVRPSNDPPVLSAGPLSQHEDEAVEIDQLSPVTFTVLPLHCNENENCPLVGFAVRDIDADESPNGLLSVTLTAGSGSFFIDPTQNDEAFSPNYLTMTAGLADNGTNYFQYFVPASKKSTALSGLTYLAFTDVFGNDQITITVSDLGNYGFGASCFASKLPIISALDLSDIPCPLKTTLTVPVVVHGKPDRLEVVVPQQSVIVQGLEDTAIPLPNISFLNHENVKSTADINQTRFKMSSTNNTYIQRPGALFNQYIQRPGATAFGSVILLNPSSHLTFDVGSNDTWSSRIVFRGSMYDINLSITQLLFLPAKSSNILKTGVMKVSIQISEVRGTGPAQPLSYSASASASADVLINVTPVNNIPIVHVPGEIFAARPLTLANGPALPVPEVVTSVAISYLREDETMMLGGVYVEDVDEGESPFITFSLAISASMGSFSTTNFTVRQAIVASNILNSGYDDLLIQQPTMLLRGSIAEINSMLPYIAYRPYYNFNGNDTIVISVCDLSFDTAGNWSANNSTLCASQAIPVVMTAVNDPPSWVLPKVPVVVEENVAFNFAGSVRVVDVDSSNFPMFVKLSVDYGSLTLPMATSNITFLVGTGENDLEMQLMGDGPSLNAALINLLYNPPLHWNSQKSGSAALISFYVDDQGSYTGSEGCFASLPGPEVGVQWNNPYNYTRAGLPTMQPTGRPTGHPSGQPTSAPTVYGQPTSVPTPEQAAGAGPFIPPWVVNGSTPQWWPAFASCDDVGIGLTAVGEVIVAVSRGINHQPYIRLPGAHYRTYPCNSQDGLYGESQVLHQVSAVSVEHQCDRIIAVDMYNLNEDQQVSIAGVSIGDVDENYLKFGFEGQYRVNVYAMHGTVYISNDAYNGYNVFVVAQDSSSFTLVGALDPLNAALAALSYQPPDHYYGEDFIDVYVSDQAYGSGGKWSNETIPLWIHAVEDSPVLSIPDALLMQDMAEDSRLVFVGITVIDPDFLQLQVDPPSHPYISSFLCLLLTF